MSASAAGTSVLDVSHLCRSCGLCCGRSLHGRVRLRSDEISWAIRHRLPLAQDGREFAFGAPCLLLHARGSERVCADYENRPEACRNYYCALATEYRRGEVDPEQAMRVIERARMLADRIGDRPEQGSDPELLLDFAELQVLVKRHFRLRDRESRSVSIDEQASNQSYWDRLFAAVTDEAPSTTVPLEPVPSTHRELREEGYTHVADVLSAGEAAAISAVVDHVVHAGWPPVFAFLHSSLWGVPKRLEPFVSGVLGDDYEMLDAVWAWRVPANSEGRGWRPHRDRCSVGVARDGTPLSITVWVALTDASPENGCIYLLPAGYDPYYRDHPEIVTVLDVQNARAVPARAGCALAWNHQVLHWGGRSSPSAARARASVAYEFRRADAMDDKPTIGRRGVPTFDERLAIVARQVVQYRELSGIDRSYVDWANDLLARRGHGGLPSGSSRHP